MERFGYGDAAASKVFPTHSLWPDPFPPFSAEWIERTKERITERKPRYSPTTTRDGFLRSIERTAGYRQSYRKNFYPGLMCWNVFVHVACGPLWFNELRNVIELDDLTDIEWG